MNINPHLLFDVFAPRHVAATVGSSTERKAEDIFAAAMALYNTMLGETLQKISEEYRKNEAELNERKNRAHRRREQRDLPQASNKFLSEIAQEAAAQRQASNLRYWDGPFLDKGSHLNTPS